jgi:hypothetical protein
MTRCTFIPVADAGEPAPHHQPQDLSDHLALLITQGLRGGVALRIACGLVCLVSRRTAHRMVGYAEEEAVRSDTRLLDEIEGGRRPDPPAAASARRHCKLPPEATLADVVRAVLADERVHRDVNHELSSQLRRTP